MRKISLPLLLMTLLAVSCQDKRKNEVEQVRTLTKAYENNKNTKTALQLDSAVKSFIHDYPQDSAGGEMVFEDANLHFATLQQPDAGLTLLNMVVTNYPNTRHAPDALMAIGYIYENSRKDTATAKATYKQVIQKYPNSKAATDAQLSLQNMGKSPEQQLQEILDKQKKDSSATRKPAVQ